MLNLFSERNKKEEKNEIFVYDEIPECLRNQIKSIFERFIIGEDNYKAYEFLHKELSEEYGMESLTTHTIKVSDKKILSNFIKNEKNIYRILDLIELAYAYKIQALKDNIYLDSYYKEKELENIVHRLNSRFKESYVGYEFVNGKFIKIDSKFTFNEITKPTLNLTINNEFQNVNEDFLQAIDDYQHGKNEDSIVKCNKAFESTMKIICSEKNWEYAETDTASKLINICLKNNLIPSELQSEFNNLQGLLQSGIPAIRNNFGGHGQGKTKREVPDSLTRYALNLTGSNIIYLIESSGL